MQDFEDFLESNVSEDELAGQGLDERQNLPYGQIDNDRDNDGEGGGLFLNKEVLPSDVVIGGKEFKESAISTRDVQTNKKKQIPGYKAKQYHMVILGFDHDEKGRPRVTKVTQLDGKEKWVISVLYALPDVHSDSKPFKSTFKGTAAWRIRQIINDFDNNVVRAATALRRKKNPQAAPMARHFFQIPIRHFEEYVGQPGNQSWACPPVAFVEGTLKPNARGYDEGISVYAKYNEGSDEERAKKIGSLYVRDEARRKLYADWIRQYGKTAVKLITQDSAQGIQVSGHFMAEYDESLAATDSQFQLVNGLAESAGIIEESISNPEDVKKLNEHIQLLRGLGKLEGGDEKSDFALLTKAGASVLIDYLKEKKQQAKELAKQAKATGSWADSAPSSVNNDDDTVPF